MDAVLTWGPVGHEGTVPGDPHRVSVGDRGGVAACGHGQHIADAIVGVAGFAGHSISVVLLDLGQLLAAVICIFSYSTIAGG